jgi:hypothetical protein
MVKNRGGRGALVAGARRRLGRCRRQGPVGKEARGLRRDGELVGGVHEGRCSSYGALHRGATRAGRHNGDGVVRGRGDRLHV